MSKFWILFVTFISIILSVNAQTQQGYVKTRGRLVNGQVIAGQRLSGVTVQVKGRNAVVSKANGTFSFPVHTNRFVVQSVKKQGYVLVDPEVTARQYSYSSDPLIFVLETPSQQTGDKLATERKLRRTLTRQLQQREDEIERLKEQNKLTEEQYHQVLQDLYAEQEKSLNLVSQMAEHYSRIDFDQLDEFDRHVSECIIEGRLTEADSLIKSKGDLKERIATHNKHHEANVEARKHLEDSEAMEIKNREDLAQDCYNQFLIHKLQHHPDSAAYYIEQRALLDTTNVDWLCEAANYFKEAGRYERALDLYLIAHNQRDSNMDAIILKEAAKIYASQGYDEKAVQFYVEAIEKYKEFSNDSIALLLNLYDCYSKISTTSPMASQSNYYHKKSEDLYHIIDSLVISSETIDLKYYKLLKDHTSGDEKEINYYKRVLLAMEEEYGQISLEVANQYRKIGLAYGLNGILGKDFSKAHEYYEKALSIFNQIDATNPLIGDCYKELAMVYRYKRHLTKEDKIKVIEFSEKYLSSYMLNYGNYHHWYYFTYLDLADMYSSFGNDTMALQNLTKAVDLNMKLYGDSTDIASAYFRIAEIYERQNNDATALEYFLLALDNSKKRAAKTCEAKDQQNISANEDRLGSFYFRQKNYKSALAIFLNLREKDYKSDVVCGKIGLCYIALSDTCKGLDYIFKTFKSLESKMEDGFPIDVKSKIEKSIELKQKGKCDESLQSVLNILQNLNVDDGQMGSYGATLYIIQRTITKLKDGLLQVLNDSN